ncbi:hypothetical protein CANARDRAFT_191899 [[Candida] arabinofermentans NRRL YB-2248]|uniref:Uncharacterized protein n=1 Tax=[Candida] arabinofermentans NRRL YB-2248 TaxID=983967 RepID=A0A1E4SXN3_9ASCO|nr:hypothetical protein CANARDRAFT_191899 [[Candida] arabinofermentans NRRL YB-2248]
MNNNNNTIIILGLNVLSLSVSKFLINTYNKKIILLSNNNIDELINNEDYVHLIELNNLNSKNQLTDIYYTLNYLNANNNSDNSNIKLIDNFEFYEDKNLNLKNDLIGLILNENTKTTHSFENCLNLKNQTIVLNPKQFLYSLYNELINLGDLKFNHIITPPQLSTLNDFINFIPTTPATTHFKKILNFLINDNLKLIRNQSILIKLQNNEKLNNSIIHKTILNQYTRLIPILENNNLILLNGPKQINDNYFKSRDSDTLNLVHRSYNKFPKILKNLQILQTKVIFKSCFDDFQNGKIWIDNLIYNNNQILEIINILGFGFNEFNSIGGVIEYVDILLKNNLESRL